MISRLNDIIEIIDGKRHYTLLDCITSVYNGISQVMLGLIGVIALPLWSVYNFLNRLLWKSLEKFGYRHNIPAYRTLEEDIAEAFNKRGIVIDISVYDGANSYLIKRRK